MSTNFRLPLKLTSVFVSAILLLGCDDPTDVGRSLVDAQAGETSVTTLNASTLESNSIGDITGGNAASGAVRVLAGVVQDPVAGRIESTGFMDFVPSSQFESTFLNNTVDFAELQLSIDYVYGDSTLPVTFELLAVSHDWTSTFTRADTTILTGDPILVTTIPSIEGKHTVEFPQEWIASNDALLRSSTFVDDFHGFALRQVSGNAILGARFSESIIRASSAPGDTVSFSLSKVISTAAEPDAPTSSDHVLLRDGSAKGLDLRFSFEGESFPEAMIHRVLMRFNTIDLSNQYPETFARPEVTLVGLRAVSEDGGSRLDIAEVIINADGSFAFDNTSLTNVVQTANLGKSVLDRFELYLPVTQSGVGYLAIEKDLTHSENYPRALVTLTPIN